MEKGHFSRSGQHCALLEKCLYSGPYFPAFGQNMERYEVSLRIQTKCWKIRTTITPNADKFYAVVINPFQSNILFGSLKFSDILNGNKTGTLT